MFRVGSIHSTWSAPKHSMTIFRKDFLINEKQQGFGGTFVVSSQFTHQLLSFPNFTEFNRNFATTPKVPKKKKGGSSKSKAKQGKGKPQEVKKKIKPKLLYSVPGMQPLIKAYTKQGKVLWHPPETSEKNMKTLNNWFKKPISRLNLAWCSVETGLTVKQIKQWYQWFRWSDVEIPSKLLNETWFQKAVDPEKVASLKGLLAKEKEKALAEDEEKKKKLKEHQEQQKAIKEKLKAEKANKTPNSSGGAKSATKTSTEAPVIPNPM